jgi:hypothetical protein
MASSADEFADALRNAHLPAGQVAYVAAQITAPDGTTHQIRRVLTADYAKRQNCQSRLEIDGKAAVEADLAVLGIALSQPPLEAPSTRSATSFRSVRRIVQPTSRASSR